MTSKIIQFQNGLKGLKKRNLNIKSKNGKEKAKKVKTSHTHKSKRNYKRNTGEWHSYISSLVGMSPCLIPHKTEWYSYIINTH